MRTLTLDLREGFDGEPVEVRLDGELCWQGEATTNVVVGLAASVPLELAEGEHELRVSLPARGTEATIQLAAADDVSVAADAAGESLRLEQLPERPYYL